MRHAHRLLTAALVLALLGAFALGAAGTARAVQNKPSWTSGDYWTLRGTEGSTTFTVQYTVIARTTLTFTGGTYSAWQVNVTTTAASGGSSFTVTTEQWIQEADLGIAKEHSSFFGETTVTYDPPMSQAVFPLSFGASWSKTTTQTTTTVFGTSSTAVSYDAAVVQEGDIVTPAGTFRAAGIQVDQFGGYEISYYSEAAGAIIRVDSYDNSDVLQNRLDLVSYKYQAGTLGLFLIGFGAIALIVLLVVVAVLASRRRRRPMMMPPGTGPYPPQGYAQGYPQGYPPVYPPQGPPGPPQGPPPPGP